MRYPNITRAEFISRPNRFIAEVIVDDASDFEDEVQEAVDNCPVSAIETE